MKVSVESLLDKSNLINEKLCCKAEARVCEPEESIALPEKEN